MSLGQAVGGIVGGTIGFFVGSPFLGAQLGMMVGGYLDPPKGPTVEGPRISDKTVQTSTYGETLPVVYGSCALNGNVFWLENNSIKEVMTKKKSGGKGGGVKTTTRTYSYYATFAVGLCRGPIVGVRRIWVGPNLIYDAGSSDPSTIAASNAAASGFSIYLGTDTQNPDSRMQATLGVANTPAYRGRAYIVFYDFPLADYGNSLMGAQVKVEVVHSPLQVTYAVTKGVTGWSTPGGIGTEAWAKAVWNGRVWCAVGYPVNCSLTSYDGLNWERHNTLPDPFHEYYDITVVGENFVICANNTYLSSDGINWQGPFNQGYVGVQRSSYANEVLLFPITGTNVLCYSYAGGYTWDHTTLPHSETHNHSNVIWVPNYNKFYMFYEYSDQEYCCTSADGLTWSSSLSGSSFYSRRSLSFIGSRIVSVVTGSTTGHPLVSTDGSTWTSYYMPYHTTGLANDGSYFVSPVTEQGIIWSQDGISWTFVPISGLTHPTDAVFNGSYFTCLNVGVSGSFSFIFVRSHILGTDSAPTLQAVVSQECLRTELLTTDDIDVSGLSGSVRGFLVGGVGSIRSSLEVLQGAWPFDIRQHGYKIQFVSRGSAAVATIPMADLDASSGEPGVLTTIQRTPDFMLPYRVSVRYLDADREYNPGEQYASRSTVQSSITAALEFPLVLTGSEAAGIAEVLLYLYWLERHELSFALPSTYNHLEPGDVVNLTTPEGVISVRLVGVNNTSDNRVECKGRLNSPAVYTPAAVAATPVTSGVSTIAQVGGVKYELLDIPMVSSAQSSPSYLLAMTGVLAGWKGGALMQSTDSGSTWTSLQDVYPPGTTMGTCNNHIGIVDSRTVDNSSVLVVTLNQGALYSITQAAMLSGQNYFAYGSDGRWEIIAVQTCTLVSGTSYTLKDMLRGRFGTEWAMGLHVIGDSLVLLDTTDVAMISATSDSIGVPSLYRGITHLRDISTDSNKAFTYKGVNLKPLSPSYLSGSINPSTHDWTLSFIPRTRDTSGWRDFVDSPMGETSESYQVDIFSDNTYSTVKRTLTASAPSISYSSTDQIADFGSNQSTLYIKVYQMSSVVGRGYPLSSSITR